MTKKEIFFLAILLFVALLVRGLFLSKSEILLPDEAYYVGMAQAMAEGRDFGGFSRTPFERSEANRGMRHGQPLVPYLFSLAIRMGGDPIRLCQWASITAALFTLIIFHLSLRSLVPLKAAFISDSIYALAPFAVRYSLWAMTHSFFILFLVTLFYFLLQLQKSGRIQWAVFSGVAAWAAYLTRVEAGLFVIFLAAAGIFFRWLDGDIEAPGKRSKLVLIFLSTFILLSIPLWIWIRKATGIWQLDWSDQYDAGYFFSRRWALPLSARTLLLPKEAAFFNLHPGLNTLGFYLKNLMGSYFLMPTVLPLPVWILIFLGLVEILSRGKQTAKPALLAFPFIIFPFLFYPLIGQDSRYYHPTYVFSLLFSGPGIYFLFEKLRIKKWGRIFCGIIVGLSFLPGYRSLILGFKEEPFEQKQMGEWLKAHYASSPQVILASDIRGCFYAGPSCKKFFQFNQAKRALAHGTDLRDFLNQNQIDLILADARYLSKFNPSFVFLLKDPPPYLEKIVQLNQGTQSITLYRFQKRD